MQEFLKFMPLYWSEWKGGIFIFDVKVASLCKFWFMYGVVSTRLELSRVTKYRNRVPTTVTCGYPDTREKLAKSQL